MRLVLFFFIFYCFQFSINSKASINRRLNSEVDEAIEIQDAALMDIPSFDVTLRLDVKALTTFDASSVMEKLSRKYPSYISTVFSRVSMLLSANNVQFSVRDSVSLSSEESISEDNKMDVTLYSGHAQVQSEPHDLFIVFDDLFELGGQLAFTNGTICLEKSVLIVDVGDDEENSPIQVASKIMYGIGGVFGFEEIDTNQKCSCGFGHPKYCTMQQPIIESDAGLTKIFDSCNIKKFKLSLQSLSCLTQTMTKERMFGICGDGFVDNGEDCDCGHDKICQELTNGVRCCDSKCKFTGPDFQCTHGECCSDCKYSKKVCRGSVGECDHAEYCSGESNRCPLNDDVFPNYQLCKEKTGLCFDGNCMDFNYMCKYAYNNSRVFFSKKCVFTLKNLIAIACEQPEEKDSVSVFCSDSVNVCGHFVCARPKDVEVKGAAYFAGEKVDCIIPNKDRKGILSQAPNFMACNRKNDQITQHCFNKKCIDFDSSEYFFYNDVSSFGEVEIHHKEYINFRAQSMERAGIKQDESIIKMQLNYAPIHRTWIYIPIVSMFFIAIAVTVALPKIFYY